MHGVTSNDTVFPIKQMISMPMISEFEKEKKALAVS